MTRSVENLVAKAKALKEEESAHMPCAGPTDTPPPPSVTGSVKKDIVFVDEMHHRRETGAFRPPGRPTYPLEVMNRPAGK